MTEEVRIYSFTKCAKNTNIKADNSHERKICRIDNSACTIVKLRTFNSAGNQSLLWGLFRTYHPKPVELKVFYLGGK